MPCEPSPCHVHQSSGNPSPLTFAKSAFFNWFSAGLAAARRSRAVNAGCFARARASVTPLSFSGHGGSGVPPSGSVVARPPATGLAVHPEPAIRRAQGRAGVGLESRRGRAAERIDAPAVLPGAGVGVQVLALADQHLGAVFRPGSPARAAPPPRSATAHSPGRSRSRGSPGSRAARCLRRSPVSAGPHRASRRRRTASVRTYRPAGVRSGRCRWPASAAGRRAAGRRRESSLETPPPRPGSPRVRVRAPSPSRPRSPFCRVAAVWHG